MSYVAIPPGYYYQQQPGTPFQEGAPGWEQAPVPGWGDNPNGAWPKYQAANGLGEGAPPPAVPRFSYVGRVPQQNYIRTAIAPWGSFPKGYAYDFPKESNCPSCIGWPSPMSIGGIIQASRDFDRGNVATAARAAMQGLGCGPCELSSGSGCQTCPSGSDLPECAGCVDGQPPATEKSLLDHPLAGPVAVAVASTLAVGIFTYFAKRAKVPVG